MNKIFFYILGILPLFATTSCIKDEMYLEKGTNTQNFDLLWKVVDEGYCYFDYKKINWDIIYKIYRPKVNDDLSKYEFFDICSDMLAELKDGHVALISDFNTGSYDDFYLDYKQNYNYNIIERSYLGKDNINANGLIAKNIRGVGYIHYTSFMNIISSKNIYEALTQMGDIQGLIIDVRNNIGGTILMVDTLVTNFCTENVVGGYIRYKESQKHNDFSNFYENRFIAKENPLYNGNIVVLTNRLVYSAANYFVSAMTALDNVTIIGDRTGGGGGAPSTSELYNGWQVLFSKTPIYNRNKEHIEFGIEPDIKVDMNILDEIEGIDTIIEYAVDYLLNK